MKGLVPKRLEEEVRRYLECGRLCYGFVHLECDDCRAATVIAFSCKSRGWCPSCTTRRALVAGLELEATLPFVVHRQWTLSLPRALRLLVVKRPALLKVVERALVKAVWRWQRQEVKRLGVGGRQAGGAVAMTQWFGSALQLTPHLHVLVPEAVWDAKTGAVTVLPPPSDTQVEQVVQRVVRRVRAAFAQVEEARWADDDEELSRLQAEAVQGRLLVVEEVGPPRRRRLLAVAQGFSLHAGTHVQANDREGLARLGRYGSRGPLAEERLSRLPDGRYRYATRKGAALTLTAEQLVRRLLALVPPPKLHLTAWHGVYAPNAKLRPVVMRAPAPPPPSPPAATPPQQAEREPPRRPRIDWATLHARTFGIDLKRCACGGRLKVHSVVTAASTAEEVLRNLGLWQPRTLLPPPRGPPQLELL